MGIAALIAWVVTALGGFYLLGTWIAKGGKGGKGGTGGRAVSRLPVPVLFGHFLLAAAGLVVWIVYLLTDRDVLAWVAFGLLVPVALLGFTMLARWLPVRRTATGPAVPPERHFPVPVVVLHGLLAVATVVLVLLTALGVAGD
ncbi:hypothetical protein GCM10010218_27040 [Streptomyces mashuensis]|uniref:Integral membrane protein n=1 Tax=Streptomyces mashuensis TaxID=33904 RepID=A0A919EBT9_9ACTN|nr:hypothetical protein [Streptomyces mashuensis]GHF44310.1 hypothetical protein GCM10010218_27040 [Streptomyces mashuensis]